MSATWDPNFCVHLSISSHYTDFFFPKKFRLFFIAAVIFVPIFWGVIFLGRSRKSEEEEGIVCAFGACSWGGRGKEEQRRGDRRAHVT